MRTRTKKQSRKTVGYVICDSGELNGPKGRPFFRVHLDRRQIQELAQLLKTCADRGERRWFTLTSTAERPERVRVTEGLTPAYEAKASPIYLRGKPIGISGNDGSCNINFSGPVGSGLLTDRLETASEAMRRFVEIRIPSRAHNLIEFIPDTRLEATESAEHQKLAVAGESMASEAWAEDDFRDWESQDG